ncbi:MAG: hypothetical protein ACLQU5_29520 [Isosphaeraceae bacterium]
MSITAKQANGRPASGLLVFAEATVRGWSALVRLTKTAYRKHSAALEAAGKAAVAAPRQARLLPHLGGAAHRPGGLWRHRRPVYFPEPARISSEYIK